MLHVCHLSVRSVFRMYTRYVRAHMIFVFMSIVIDKTGQIQSICRSVCLQSVAMFSEALSSCG